MKDSENAIASAASGSNNHGLNKRREMTDTSGNKSGSNASSPSCCDSHRSSCSSSQSACPVMDDSNTTFRVLVWTALVRRLWCGIFGVCQRNCSCTTTASSSSNVSKQQYPSLIRSRSTAVVALVFFVAVVQYRSWQRARGRVDASTLPSSLRATTTTHGPLILPAAGTPSSLASNHWADMTISNASTTSSSSKNNLNPVSCSVWTENQITHQNDYYDPNDGVLWARRLVTEPSFVVAVHTQTYDNVRFKSIYRRGAYYEKDVHARFVHILTNAKASATMADATIRPPLVLDVGMNIGYYSLLSAALGAQVAAFEINPANVLRMCESLRLNANDAHSSVAIFRRGISQVDGIELHVEVPRNPGQAHMAEADATPSLSSIGLRQSHATDWVTTLTLDTFAKEQGWLEDTPENDELNIAILKIDIEGLEPECFLGAKALLASGKVQHILTEFRHFKKDVAQQAFQLLLDSHYRMVVDDLTTTPGDETVRVLTLSETKHLWHLKTQHTHPFFRRVFLRSEYVEDLWFTHCDEACRARDGV